MPLSWSDVAKTTQDAGKVAYGSNAAALSLPELIGRLINIAIGITGLVFLGLGLYGGYLWFTSQGDTKKLQEAKDTVKNAIIGLVVMFAAYALTNFILTDVIGYVFM